jgi:hypothetical protein
LTTFPAINTKCIPATCTIGLVPAANGVVVQLEKFCDSLAGLPVIQQQDRIGPTRNTMIFALTTHANLKLTTLYGGKKTGTDHALT